MTASLVYPTPWGAGVRPSLLLAMRTVAAKCEVMRLTPSQTIRSHAVVGACPLASATGHHWRLGIAELDARAVANAADFPSDPFRPPLVAILKAHGKWSDA